MKLEERTFGTPCNFRITRLSASEIRKDEKSLGDKNMPLSAV